MLSKWTTKIYKATMGSEFDIFDYLKNHIKELIPVQGLSIRFEVPGSKEKEWRPDFIADVSFKKDVQFKLAAEILTQPSASIFKAKIALLKSYSKHNDSLIPFLVAKYLSHDRRRQCQEEGVYFLDLSGNVFLAHDGLYIERIGFRNRFPEKRMGRGPFSDKASLILRAVFSDIKKLWGVRELAEGLGLDPGFVSRMARELEQRNYISRIDSKIKMRNPKGILEDWVSAYDYRKNKEVRYFCLGKGPDEIIGKVSHVNISNRIQYALGLHAGASLVSPYAVYNEVHIYVQDQKDIKWFVEKLKLREAKKGTNLIFLLPYYKHSVFYGKQKIRGLWVVSDLQLYLDLYNYPIRGREQAEHLYEKRLAQIIEG